MWTQGDAGQMACVLHLTQRLLALTSLTLSPPTELFWLQISLTMRAQYDAKHMGNVNPALGLSSITSPSEAVAVASIPG